jgi:hypothetical protein
VPPVVLHLTRGRFDPAEIQEAVGPLREAGVPAAVLYHLVMTESPHRSLAYPAAATPIEDPSLARLLELSSPLLGRRGLASEKPAVSPESLGMVVNGRFDLLLDGMVEALAASHVDPGSQSP